VFFQSNKQDFWKNFKNQSIVSVAKHSKHFHNTVHPLANKLNNMYAKATPIYFYHLQKQDVQSVTAVLVPGFISWG
jgi:hypothetical protein